MADRDEKGKFLKGHSQGFKPGCSGNPGGRPRDYQISEAIAEELRILHHSGITTAQGIAKRLVYLAADGNIQAIREVIDRMEGRPRQSLDIDMQVTDWRESARLQGISEKDVIEAARTIIDEFDADSTSASHRDETEEGSDESGPAC